MPISCIELKTNPPLQIAAFPECVYLEAPGHGEVRIRNDNIPEVAKALLEALETIKGYLAEAKFKDLEGELQRNAPVEFRFETYGVSNPHYLCISNPRRNEIQVSYFSVALTVTPDQLARLLKAAKGELDED